MRGLIVQKLDRNEGECDMTVMFADYQHVEINLIYKERHIGEARLHVWIEGHQSINIDLKPKP